MPTPVDDEPWPPMEEFSQLANDAVYGGGVRDRIPELDSGRASNTPWGPVKAVSAGPPRETDPIGDARDDAGFSMTPEQRYLFDTQGFVSTSPH